jgi:hypothetical protein
MKCDANHPRALMQAKTPASSAKNPTFDHCFIILHTVTRATLNRYLRARKETAK